MNGIVKTPKPENPELAPDAAEILCRVRIGDVVYFRMSADDKIAPWPALVVRLKENDILDLAVHRPDGVDMRYWDVPLRNSKRLGHCWEPRGD